MKIKIIAILLFLLAFLAACSTTTPVHPAPSATPTAVAPADQVSIHEATLDWETYRYGLTVDNAIAPGSFDRQTKTRKTFKTWVLENKYLKVTLLPEMGGRILSIFYKPTGHEELYQNPVGVPYGIRENVFYYNWLMVYGGIFPTFPEPEHGKSWILPWDFKIVNQSEQAVTIIMSFTDDIDSPAAPYQYNVGKTGLKVNYYVTLKAGRAAVDAKVEIINPGQASVKYEYWTNTTLAPGSDPANPKTTAGAEIIAPVEKIKIPRYWRGIAAIDESLDGTDVHSFKALRRFENWPESGIAYASPDMQGHNFWGVINHDNEEGIFRIADNNLTPGLKIWTWGYPTSISIDPHTSTSPSRPYIELWAGVSREFWQRAQFPANSQMEIEETYSPSVGLTDVTHASTDFLFNLAADGTCQLFGLYPDQTVEISLAVGATHIFTKSITLDPLKGNDCSANIPAGLAGEALELTIRNSAGDVLFEGTGPKLPSK